MLTKRNIKPDIGLPIYRPELGAPKAEHRGTQLVAHTFDPGFLPRLLTVSRQHKLKLASVMHAALLVAVHQSMDMTPSPEDVFRSGSVLDLRNGWMLPPYSELKEFVNIATSSLPIIVPCALFNQPNSFWGIAKFIAKIWAGVSNMRGIANAMEAGAKAVVEASENEEWVDTLVKGNQADVHHSPLLDAGPSYPKTCPYFVSDPPGSQILSKTFDIVDSEDLQLVLESYQMATDQIQSFWYVSRSKKKRACQSQTLLILTPFSSGRAHSWDDKLTLCLVFNGVRNPEEKIQAVLDKWASVLETVCEEHEKGSRSRL